MTAAATDGRVRCGWVPAGDALYTAYHDEEWGVPLRDETRLFEMLTLEGAQAGLSWITVLRRRETYRAAFANWDVERIAAFDDDDRARLLADPGIIRNRSKVDATIGNARIVVGMHEAGETLESLLWSFVGEAPMVNRRESLSDVPAQTAESVAMSKELTKRGFRFVGPTICYALMQACGLVNDHTIDCFRWSECQG